MCTDEEMSYVTFEDLHCVPEVEQLLFDSDVLVVQQLENRTCDSRGQFRSMIRKRF